MEATSFIYLFSECLVHFLLFVCEGFRVRTMQWIYDDAIEVVLKIIFIVNENT